MNLSNLTFISAAHCEVYGNQFAAHVQSLLAEMSDDDLRQAFVMCGSMPVLISQSAALTYLRELQRRLEVRELES